MFENLRIKERLTKAFVMVAAITAIGAVVGLAAMLVMSNRYSSALVNYGFSQGDIGKAMITFANTRSATRGIIGFDEQGLVDDAMTEHDEQKAKFENYFATVGDVITTSEEKALYQQISDKLQQYWAAEEPIIEQGATTDATQSTAAQQQMEESLDPIYEDIYADMIELMNTKVTEGDRLSSTLTAVSVILAIVIVAVSALAIRWQRESPDRLRHLASGLKRLHREIFLLRSRRFPRRMRSQTWRVRRQTWQIS